MPWKAVGNKIVRADTGKVVGHSSSHEMAERAVRARYAHSPEFHKKKGKHHFGHVGAAMSKKKGK